MSTIEYTMSMEGYHSEDELSPEDVKRMRDEVSTKLEDVSGPLEDAGAKAPLSRLEVVNG
jgi:exopolyphosphatase/pppGpp-phosphohydrolase